MPDELNEDGLQTKTLEELREELVEDFQGIYGVDINADPNSQDGQQLKVLLSRIHKDTTQLSKRQKRVLNSDNRVFYT